jgi:hypothetical protein
MRETFQISGDSYNYISTTCNNNSLTNIRGNALFAADDAL